MPFNNSLSHFKWRLSSSSVFHLFNRGFATLLLVIFPVSLPSAEELNEQWQHKLHELSSNNQLSGVFQQSKKLKILKKPIKSSGLFSASQDAGLVWQTQQPAPSTIVIKGEKIYQIEQEQKHLLSDGQQSSAITRIMLLILTGDIEQLNRHFTIEPLSESNTSNQHWSLKLTPVSANIAKLFSEILLIGNQHIEQAILKEPNGTQSQLIFSQLSKNSLHPQHQKLLNDYF